PFRNVLLVNFLFYKEFDQLVQSQSLALSQDHTGAHALAENRIRHRHAGDVLDRWMSQDEVLNFLGTDFFAAPVNEILLSSFHHIVPRRMTPHQIPRAIKAISRERSGIVLRHAEVTAERVGTAGQ